MSGEATPTDAQFAEMDRLVAQSKAEMERPVEAELFRFEVPSPRGNFVIIGPDDLTPVEAAAVNRKLSAVFVAMFTPAPTDPPAAALDPSPPAKDRETT